MFPAFFLGHGSPMIAIEKSPYTDFLSKLKQSLPKKPASIILFTAHWESSTQKISAFNSQYDMIYDFGGFPKELFQVVYKAKGNLALAQEVKELLAKEKIKSDLDTKRGADHGTWTLLKNVFPEADIPVVQMSVNPNATPEEIYKIGKALAPLREKDVMIIGSGAIVHNLGLFRTSQFDTKNLISKSQEFESWLVKNVEGFNVQKLLDYYDEGPNAQMCVPTVEHFIPFLYALGAGSNTKKAKVDWTEVVHPALSYTAVRFE